jgi:hypothetical protein
VTLRRRSVAVRASARDASKTLRRAATIAGLAVGLVLATQAQWARAGSYEMWNCSAPGRAGSLLDPWFATEWLVPNVSIFDMCATGGGWGVNLTGTREVAGGYGAGLTLSRPIGPRSQIAFVKLTVWYAARLSGSGQPMHLLWNNYRSSDGHHLTPVTVPPDSENAVAEFDLDSDTVHVQLAFRCGSEVISVTNPCVAAHSVPLLIRGMKVTLSEDAPPIVSRLGGGLLDTGPQSGIRPLAYSVSDPESGLSKIEVLLDGNLVASNDLTARCSHTDFSACAVSDNGILQVDTRLVANGSHRLALRVWDAAGNAQEVQGDSAVEVLNQPSPSGRPTEATDYRLDARFTTTLRPTVTVPYGKRVSIRGRLTRPSGPVAGGSPIEVLERRDRRGAREVSRARFKTQADGSFSAVLVTTRPSRTIRLAYHPTADSQVLSQPLKLRVRAASKVRASLRGRIVSFSGNVLSGPISKEGKRVLMEGRAPGSAWTVFQRLHTDRMGRFSGTYRLRVRRPGVTLKIRAVVPREDGYGYLSSRSRAVALRVR